MTLDEALARWPGALTFDFGDSRDLSERLIALVRAGRKTATCGALRDYLAEGEQVPQAGDICIVRDWDGNPALVVEEIEVAIRRFADVPEDFALAEGEDADFAGWEAGHRAYFARNGGWSPDMLLVCERFRLLADLGVRPASAEETILRLHPAPAVDPCLPEG